MQYITEQVVEVLKTRPLPLDTSVQELQQFLKRMSDAGLVTKRPYDLPPPNTLRGRTFGQRHIVANLKP